MASIFMAAFVAALALMVVLKYWLAARQMRHVSRHANAVPVEFAGRIGLDAHRKAAAYTIARTRLGLVDTFLGAAVLVALTLLGGLQWLASQLEAWLGTGLSFQVAIVAVVAVILSAIDLPLAWVRQFRLEARFGFNRMTPALWIKDLIKSTLLAAALGLPLLAAILWLWGEAGQYWWLWAWLVWVAFNTLVLLLFPTVIAPLFNKFEPLADGALAARIQSLLARAGFASSGVFVMDGSKRSAHGNAYFTGFGRAKRIVFFDTLMQKLAPAEIEAVLAHELGHFKLRHIVKRLAFSFLMSLAFLALLGGIAQQPWFYLGLGVDPLVTGRNDGLALVLFMLALPVFTFPLAPISSLFSRQHEYEADAYAASVASAEDLSRALVKLYEDNAATLTPDPLHSAFYDSHPPAALRLARLAGAN
ncbi:MAG: M48 family metallopeptidase [Burkholderiaceae bacterium]